MKKFATLLFLLLLLIALPVSAEKIKFKDKNCEFANYSNVQLTGITSLQIDKTDFEIDPTAESKVKMMLMSAFNKKKINLITDTEAGQISPKFGFDVKIYVFGNDKIWHDAWTEMVTSYKTVYVDDYDSHGHYHSRAISVPYTEPVFHPAGYYYTARVDMEIGMKDLRTDKLVYSIRDTRSRGGETDTSGMLKRICSDFVDDVTNNS